MDRLISLVVLSGGLNSRMHGLKKGMLLIQGETFLARIYRTARPLVSEALLVTRQPEAYLNTSYRPVTDLYSLRSSLTGIHAGLAQSENDWNLIVPCDAPLVKRDLLSLLIAQTRSDLDAIVPRCGRYFEPLCALYSKRCLPAVESLLGDNRPKVSNLFELVRVQTLQETALRRVDPDLESFVNVNTEEDLARIRRSFEGREKLEQPLLSESGRP